MFIYFSNWFYTAQIWYNIFDIINIIFNAGMLAKDIEWLIRPDGQIQYKDAISA